MVEWQNVLLYTVGGVIARQALQTVLQQAQQPQASALSGSLLTTLPPESSIASSLCSSHCTIQDSPLSPAPLGISNPSCELIPQTASRKADVTPAKPLTR